MAWDSSTRCHDDVSTQHLSRAELQSDQFRFLRSCLWCWPTCKGPCTPNQETHVLRTSDFSCQSTLSCNRCFSRSGPDYRRVLACAMPHSFRTYQPSRCIIRVLPGSYYLIYFLRLIDIYSFQRFRHCNLIAVSPHYSRAWTMITTFSYYLLV